MAKKVTAKKSKVKVTAVRDNSPDKTRGTKKMPQSAANPTRDNNPNKTGAASVARRKAAKKPARAE